MEIREYNKKLFLGCFIIGLLLFGINCTLEFATDTYFTLTNSTWQHMLYDNGRVISGLIYYIFEGYLHLSAQEIYSISYICAILFLTVSLYFLAKTIATYCKNALYSILIASSIIANIFSIEYFLFIEKGIFMLGILFVILAFYFTYEFFDKGNIKNIIFSEFLLIGTVYIYQQYAALYVILCLPFIIKYADTFLKFIQNNIIVALMYGISMGIANITTKYVLHSYRLPENYNINIINTINNIKNAFINSGFIIPKYLFVFTILFAIVINIMLEKKNILYTMYLVMGIIIVTYIPYFIGITSDYSIRIMYPAASIVGILILNAVVNNFKETGLTTVLSMGLLLILFLVQMYSFNCNFIERYKCNQTDKYICSIIIDRINKYQLENNLEIDTICIYEDSQRTWSYEGLNRSWLNPRAFVTSWSDVNAINYFSGRNFERGEVNEEVRDYFASHNWDTFSDEQLIFEGHILHLCVY